MKKWNKWLLGGLTLVVICGLTLMVKVEFDRAFTATIAAADASATSH